MHEVSRDLAHERAAVHVGAHRAAVMHMRAACAREVREPAVLEHALLVAAVDAWREVRRIHARVGRRARGHAFETLLRRIAGGVLLRHEIDEQRIGVRRVVEPAERVLAHAPLAVRRDGLGAQRGSVGNEAKWMLRADEGVVEREEEPVAGVLGVVLSRKAARDQLGGVRASVAIGVAAEIEMRRLDHEHAISPQCDSTRHHESIEEHGGLVHAPVAIGVAQDLDAAKPLGLACAFGVAHVARHLDDPEAAVGSELKGDGRLDQGLRGDELDSKSVHQLEGRERAIGRKDRRVGHLPRGRDLALRLAGAIALLAFGCGGEHASGENRRGNRDRRDTHARK